MQSRRRQSYSRQVAVSHLAVPSRLQVASQSYFHQSVTFLYVTDSGDYGQVAGGPGVFVTKRLQRLW